MSFGKLQKLVAFSLSVIALTPVSLSGEISVVVSGLAFFLFGVGFFLEPPFISKPFYRTVYTSLVILLFAVQFTRVGLGVKAAQAIIEFTALLLGLKLCSRKSYADYQQVLVLSFLVLIASTVTSYTVSYAVFFIGFVFLVPLSLILGHLRVEMETRFGKNNERSLKKLLASKRIIKLKFISFITLIAVALLIITSVIFISLPRFGMGFGGNALFTKDLLGFTDTVQIGDLSKTIENDDIYVRIWPNQKTKNMAKVIPIKLRGAVFDTYENGGWKTKTTSAFYRMKLYAGRYHLVNRSYVDAPSFTIMQEPTNPSFLFVPLGTAFIETSSFKRRGRVRYKPLKMDRAGQVKYDDPSRVGIKYTVTLGNSFIPGRGIGDKDVYLRLPSNFEHVKTLSNTWAKSGSDKQRTINIVRELKRYGYAKTVSELKRAQSKKSDILDKFLFEYKQGTCEHFATAATLLLRAQGIPARFVTGFSSAKWNSVGGYYYVRATAAHAWTEAWIDDKWVTIDATPSTGGGGTAQQLENRFQFVGELFDLIAMHWHQYVIDYNSKIQGQVLQKVTPKISAGSLKKVNLNLMFLIGGLGVFGIGLYFVFKSKKKKISLLKSNQRRSVHLASSLIVTLEKKMKPKFRERFESETAYEYVKSAAKQYPHVYEALIEIINEYHALRFGKGEITKEKTTRLRKQITLIEL